ncbi:MAG: hypothetical protein HZC47_01225 [Methanobacterium sp.]|uniref:hypothetical protein n=1 Tax=Methanobacterium sp. TaxID=2164 RepID=UPI003D65E373|nr:hypothetical protein [Methanobacterium sp.]
MAIRDNKSYKLKGELSILGTGFDFQGVKNLISDLEDLKSSGIYYELFYVFSNWREPVDTTLANKQLQPISPFLTRAISNNLDPEQANVFSGSIDYYSFYNLYRFINWIYSMNLRRCLHEDDVKAVFSSDILEKIILGLEKFKFVQSTASFNDNDFFYHIRQIKWTDKHTERFHDKLHDLLASKCCDEIGDREISFKRELKRITKLLAACNALNKERINMTTSDIISAYKILFTIMRTDMSLLINKNAYTGLLTCHGCNGYYQLQEDETPNDFVYCSCGSTLMYTKSLEEVEYHGETIKELMIDGKGLIAGVITSLSIAFIFHNIALLTLFSGFITVFMAKNHTHDFKYGFLTGNISGSLLVIAIFIFGIIISGIKLNNISSIGDITIFIFILVLGVFAIYCGRIGTFLLKQFKNRDMVPVNY